MKAPHQAITKFQYNPLGELTRSTDPEGNHTDYSYNMLGQLLERNHPDAGLTSYNYDKAGNLRSIQTANLSSGNDSIIYIYDYNRVVNIEYPENPENNVYYEYGNSGNNTGRLTLLQDASGLQTFAYGKLGELTENIHTYVMPGGNQQYTFKTEWEYDSWNRLSKITYPDDEVVTYSYDDAGQLDSVDGDKGNNHNGYVEGILYDKFGSRTKMNYGNGTEIQYQYDSRLHRLQRLISKDGNATEIQDVTYDYDDAGNITEIENTAGEVNGLGGDYLYQYNYDSLYRLTGATGSFHNNDFDYELGMSYSASGNILSKNLTAHVAYPVVRDISYDFDYSYSTGQPHAIDNIYDNNSGRNHTHDWDANGNLTTQMRPGMQFERNLCWDEENRLTAVRDDNYLSGYIYNAGGERVWKITGPIREMTINGDMVVDHAFLDDKTLYQSPYMVVTDYDYTKHYYIESQRISSKIGGGFGNADIDPVNEDSRVPIAGYFNNYEDFQTALMEMLLRSFECVGHGTGYYDYEPVLQCMEELSQMDEPEEQLYFYHSDHLGSSAFITDAGGNAHQHMQYLPFGETFIDQRIDWKPRFTFTDKEKDRNTGYSYFGARYYDSEVSVWLSVDPLSDKYPSTSPYMYVLGMPTALIDPNGMNSIKMDETYKELMYEIGNNKNVKLSDIPKAKNVGEFLANAADMFKHGDRIKGTEIKELVAPSKDNPGEKEFGEILDAIDYLKISKDGDETIFSVQLKKGKKEISKVFNSGDLKIKLTIRNGTKLNLKKESGSKVNLNLDNLGAKKLGRINVPIPMSAFKIKINKNQLNISKLGMGKTQNIFLPDQFKSS